MQWVHYYGYFGIFALLVLGIVEVPVSDETLLAFCGYLAQKGNLLLVPTITHRKNKRVVPALSAQSTDVRFSPK